MRRGTRATRYTRYQMTHRADYLTQAMKPFTRVSMIHTKLHSLDSLDAGKFSFYTPIKASNAGLPVLISKIRESDL